MTSQTEPFFAFRLLGLAVFAFGFTSCDSITVSASKPKANLIPLDVRSPPERAEVGELVRPALRNGLNVIDFPTKD